MPDHQLCCVVLKGKQEKQTTGGQSATKANGHNITLKNSGLSRSQTALLWHARRKIRMDKSFPFQIIDDASNEKKILFVSLFIFWKMRSWTSWNCQCSQLFTAGSFVQSFIVCYQETHSITVVSCAVGGSVFCRYVLLAHTMSFRFSSLLCLWRNSTVQANFLSGLHSSFGWTEHYQKLVGFEVKAAF